MDSSEIFEIIPNPLYIELSVDVDYEDEVSFFMKKFFFEDTDKFNFIFFEIETFSDYLLEMPKNNICRIKVDNEVVSVVESQNNDDNFFIENFCIDILNSVEDVFNEYHEQIVNIQNKQADVLYQLEKDCSYDVLYSFYDLIGDKLKTFYFLKKLATRYKYSIYAQKLKRIHSIRNDRKRRKSNMGRKFY